MKKALRKEISNMLKSSITLTLNSIDEKASAKIKKSVEKAVERLTKKFAKNLKGKRKLKGQVNEIVGKKSKTLTELAEPANS